MKKTLYALFITILTSSTVHAASISILGPCENEASLVQHIPVKESLSVGELSIKLLNQHGISYIGSVQGITSMFGTPTGLDALEVTSDTELFAYGWCYSVNGIEPALFSDEVFIGDDDHIQWWYGYAHYLKGEWVSQCEASYLRSNEKFCDSL